MKKATSPSRAREVPKTVQEYIASVPEPACTTLKRVRATIRSLVPAETTEVISYRIPAFRYKGMLLWYAAFKDHCSLFPGSKAVIARFKDELASYALSKGTIQFPLDKPLPAALLKKIVKARLAEQKLKAKS